MNGNKFSRPGGIQRPACEYTALNVLNRTSPLTDKASQKKEQDWYICLQDTVMKISSLPCNLKMLIEKNDTESFVIF